MEERLKHVELQNLRLLMIIWMNGNLSKHVTSILKREHIFVHFLFIRKPMNENGFGVPTDLKVIFFG
ncbi:hypothetical protein Lepto1548_08870 [Leptospira interrogans serovar Bataviae]|nr:hypothetical protein Lepto1548_00305 [Leptospira interrogans serovar Bataviae]QOI38380.1 hypothetical protein Lepto1548_08870 [Leptospira interrogans serovar Bataviae]